MTHNFCCQRAAIIWCAWSLVAPATNPANPENELFLSKKVNQFRITINFISCSLKFMHSLCWQGKLTGHAGLSLSKLGTLLLPIPHAPKLHQCRFFIPSLYASSIIIVVTWFQHYGFVLICTKYCYQSYNFLWLVNHPAVSIVSCPAVHTPCQVLQPFSVPWLLLSKSSHWGIIWCALVTCI